MSATSSVGRSTGARQQDGGVAATAKRFSPRVLLTFATPDHDLMAFEMDVFDMQVETFLKSQARTVKERHDQPGCASQVFQDRADFIEAENDGNPNWALGMRHMINRARIDPENLTIQEQ